MIVVTSCIGELDGLEHKKQLSAGETITAKWSGRKEEYDVKTHSIVIGGIVDTGKYEVVVMKRKSEMHDSFDFYSFGFTIKEKDETADWKTYRNEKYGFEVKYPDNILQLDSNKSTISHTLKNFHKYSEKDRSDLGLASDISIVFKKEESTDKGCDYLEQILGIKSNGILFQSKNVSGIKYESGAEGEGVFDYCIKNNEGRNIFWIRRYFLKESYSTELPKQPDYIPSKEQERIFNQILSTFKFIN